MNIGQPQGKVKPDFDITKTTAEVCEKCQGEAFREAFLFRRVSPLLSDSGKGGFLPVQVFACVKCGHVNNDFVPTELRSSLVKPS